MAQTMFQTVGSGIGGGGPSTVAWYLPDGSVDFPCGMTANETGLECLVFGFDDTQRAYGVIPIPTEYVTGTQIFLKSGLFYLSLTTGLVLIRSTTYIYREGRSAIILPNGYTSTNTEQAPNGTANFFETISDIDLTNSSGQIDSVSVVAGDVLFVRLGRLPGSESVSPAVNVNLLRDSLKVVMT